MRTSAVGRETGTGAPAAPPRPRPGRWAFHADEFVPLDEARLPLTTQGLHYGTGVFEGIRGYAGADGRVHLFRLAEHYRRFLRSCRLMRVDLGHSAAELADITVELLARNGFSSDSYVRPLAYKLGLLPGTAPGVGLSGVSDALSIVASELGDYTPAGGLRCVVSSWRLPRRDTLPAQAKITGGYVTNALALEEARAAGCDDAIMLTADGRVGEATTANVFVVQDGVLHTPPVSTGILAGVTRDTVLALAAELCLPATEADLDPADLVLGEELLLTGTGIGIAPVVELDGRPIGDGAPGPVGARLAETYQRVVRAEHPGRTSWLTTVGPR
ncbi:aminotransferase class IV [Actinophytocola sp.]|uniref:aminotransferase class IV n=1 Tax=Actinophytocola sp. TaxID=1872138 RepID=UPI00389AE547